MSTVRMQSICPGESVQGKGESLGEKGNRHEEFSPSDDCIRDVYKANAKWGFPISRFKSNSMPLWNASDHREKLSVYSEPCQKTNTEDSNDLVPELFNTARSTSDVQSPRNDSDSEPSIADLFKNSENTDPVVIFWEKSEKQQVESSVIVKFTLQAGEVFTHAFPKDSKVFDMKQVISEIFKIPISMVQLEHSDCVLQDCISISNLTIERFGTVGFHLISLDPIRYPLILNNVYPDIPTNDVLTVMVHKGEQVIKEVIVEIENKTIRKPFLGGYRHQKTGLEYHHAFSQTAARPSKENVASRMTQTPGISRTTDINVDKYTQTLASDSEKVDRKNILYGNAERYMQRQEKVEKLFQDKVSLIQRNLRSWLVRKMMIKMKEEYKRCIEWERKENIKKEDEKQQQQKKKELSLKYPQCRGDFELMYHKIKLWRQTEAERIRSIDSSALRKAELCTVLETEIKLINAIENQRIRFKSEVLKKAQENFLEKTATPLKWKSTNGYALSMDSIGTQRARQLKELYQVLLNTQVPSPMRISLLSDIKKAVHENENSLTPELTSLLDRECQILTRDLKQVDLGTLRERIQFLFLEYIKDPSVNPEAAKEMPREICHNFQMYKCISCQNVLPYYKFPLYSKANNFQKCTHCCWVRRVGGPRTDVNPIRHIMNAIRRDELRQRCYSSVALIMQEQDYYHLIINIWLGHSAIGGSGNLEELRMGRWNFKENWSPWNCILLTGEELRAHLRFSNPEQIYSPLFVKKIKQRHQMGKIHFSELVSHCAQCTSKDVDVDSLEHNFRAARAQLTHIKPSDR